MRKPRLREMEPITKIAHTVQQWNLDSNRCLDFGSHPMVLDPLNVKFCPRDTARKIIRKFTEGRDKKLQIYHKVSPAWGFLCPTPLLGLGRERGWETNVAWLG